jgi:hypothetical protein
VGTFAPLAVAYRIERSMKRGWARSAGYEVPPDLPLTAGACLGLLVLLALLALLATQLMLRLPVYDPARCGYGQ